MDMLHTSYLSRVHGSYPWRKICHVEKFQISIHLSWGEIWNFSPLIMWRQSRFLHITDVDKFEISLHMSCGDNSDFSTSFVAFSLFCCKITPFLQFTLFCRDLRVFAWRKIEPKIVPVEQSSIKCGTAGPAVLDSDGPSSIAKTPNIRSFVAKSVLSRFTRFCVEKN